MSKLVYQGNKPACTHCGLPIEDSDDRDQHAGKVYHSDYQPCRDAYLVAGGKLRTGARAAQSDESAVEDVKPEDEPTEDLELSDDDLARAAITLGEEARRLSSMADAAFFDLENRLIARGATKFEGEHYRGKLLSGGVDHTIDDMERFRERLGPLLSQADQDRAFPLPRKRERGIDQRVINDLKKLGGEVAAIITEERRTVARRDRLKIEEIESEEKPADAGE